MILRGGADDDRRRVGGRRLFCGAGPGRTQRVQPPVLPKPPPDLDGPLGQSVLLLVGTAGAAAAVVGGATNPRPRIGPHASRRRRDPDGQGERYVVSTFGTISDWVHNLEAANGDAVVAHGGSVLVHLVKVPADERAPILQEYVRVASSGRKHFPLAAGAPVAEFAAIASQYPVYRIERAQ